MQLNKEIIISKVKKLMTEKGTLKIKLGEVLGIRVSATSQAKAERANRFLSGKQKSINIDELNAIAKFFERPVEFLLTPKTKLAQRIKPYVRKKTKTKKR